MKTVAIIPARLASTRLPQKMLREIDGKPLVGWVYEAVASSRLLSDVIVATDSEVILDACRRHGWKAQLTSTSHRSGTERVREVSNGLAADVYVNVQGDEPLVRPEQIARPVSAERFDACLRRVRTLSGQFCPELLATHLGAGAQIEARFPAATPLGIGDRLVNRLQRLQMRIDIGDAGREILVGLIPGIF